MSESAPAPVSAPAPAPDAGSASLKDAQQPSSAPAPAPKPEGAPAAPAADDFNEAAAAKLLQKYKNDPKEVLKALYNSQKEYAKLRNETKSKGEQPKPEAAKPEAKTEAPESASFKQAIDYMQREILDTGKVSDEVKNSLKAIGYSDADIAREVQLRTSWIQQQTAAAQKFVETPVKELLDFARGPGNLTDSELAFYQNALDLAVSTGNTKYYQALRTLEQSYKDKKPATIEHGTPATGPATPAGAYASAEEWRKDTRDIRYNMDPEYTAMVKSRLSVTNTDGWERELLRPR